MTDNINQDTAVCYMRTPEGSHQFRTPTVEGDNILAVRVTEEGIIIDIEDGSGEVIHSSYQLWSDLEDTATGEE